MPRRSLTTRGPSTSRTRESTSLSEEAAGSTEKRKEAQMNSIFLEKPQEAVLSWLQHSVALKYEGDSSFKKRVFTGSAVQASSIPKTDGSRKLVAAQVSQRV